MAQSSPLYIANLAYKIHEIITSMLSVHVYNSQKEICRPTTYLSKLFWQKEISISVLQETTKKLSISVLQETTKKLSDMTFNLRDTV